MSHPKQLTLEQQITNYAHKQNLIVANKIVIFALAIILISALFYNNQTIMVIAWIISLCSIISLPIACIKAKEANKNFLVTSALLIASAVISILGLLLLTITAFLKIQALMKISGITAVVALLIYALLTVILVIQSIVFVCKKSPIDNRVKQACKQAFMLDGKAAQKSFAKQLKVFSQKRQYQDFVNSLDQIDQRYLSAHLPYDNVEQAIETINKIVINAGILDGKGVAKSLRQQLNRLWETRNHQDIAKLKAQYDMRMEQRKAEILANVSTVSYQPEYNGESKLDGNALQKFGISTVCFFVNLLTLNIARPFTVCWKQRWLAKHTVIDGKRLSFDGNGMQLFGKWIIWLLLSVVTLGIYGLVISIKFRKWIAQHTHVQGEYIQLGGTFDGTILQSLGIAITSLLLNIVTLFIATPYTVCRKLRWQSRHTVNDGRRMTFDGNGMQLFGKWILWLLLSVVTLGIYTIFLSVKLKKWTTSHTHFTEQQEFVM